MVDPQAIVRSITSELSEVAADINSHHETIGRLVSESLDHIRQAGELLLKVKSELPHGQFTPWVKQNCQFKERTARDYMAAARNWTRIEQERQRAAGLNSLREVMRFLAAPEEKPVSLSEQLYRHDLGEHSLEEWEPGVGEAVLGELPDGRHLWIESLGDNLTYIRTAVSDDEGLTFDRRGWNRHHLFFFLLRCRDIDVNTVEWIGRWRATRENNPFAEYIPEWKYGKGAAE